jgi:hypothetical protein
MESLALAITTDVRVGATAGLLALLGLLCLCVRAELIRRELAQRRRWLVEPARELDPSEQDVRHFAMQLGRARGSVQARMLKPSAGTRIVLQSIGDGQVRYVLETPRAGAGVLEGAMYRKVELRRAGDREEPAGPPSGLMPDVDLLSAAAADQPPAESPQEVMP